MKKPRPKKPSPLSEILYARVRPENLKWAYKKSEYFGSLSAFMDHLISQARGIKSLPRGGWLPKKTLAKLSRKFEPKMIEARDEIPQQPSDAVSKRPETHIPFPDPADGDRG
jgi:hypothetical protein